MAEPLEGTQEETSGSADTGEDLKARGREKAEDLKARGRDKAEELKGRGREKTEELKERGREKAEELKGRAAEETERRSSEAADRLDAVIKALHSAADRLDEDGEAWLSGYARRAAGQVDRATDYLRGKDAGRMLSDLEETARENPGTFLGTAFASGVALGRFLRSSSPDGESSRETSGGPAGSELVEPSGTERSGGRWSAGQARTGYEAAPERGIRTGGSAMASEAAGGLPAEGGTASAEARTAREE